MTTSLVDGSRDPLQVGGSPGTPHTETSRTIHLLLSKSPPDGCGASLDEVLKETPGTAGSAYWQGGSPGVGVVDMAMPPSCFLRPELREAEGQGWLTSFPPTIASDGNFPSAFVSGQLFATPWTIACQAPLSVGFSRQEYCSGSLFPSPEDLPNPGIEPASPVSPALQVDSLPTEPSGKSSLKTK